MTHPSPFVAAGLSRRPIVIVIAAGLVVLLLCAIGFCFRGELFAQREASTARLASSKDVSTMRRSHRSLAEGLARLGGGSLPEGTARVDAGQAASG